MLANKARIFPIVYVAAKGTGFPSISCTKCLNDENVIIYPTTKHAAKPMTRCMWHVGKREREKEIGKQIRRRNGEI
jgi:hypothetical protein